MSVVWPTLGLRMAKEHNLIWLMTQVWLWLQTDAAENFSFIAYHTYTTSDPELSHLLQTVAENFSFIALEPYATSMGYLYLLHTDMTSDPDLTRWLQTDAENFSFMGILCIGTPVWRVYTCVVTRWRVRTTTMSSMCGSRQLAAVSRCARTQASRSAVARKWPSTWRRIRRVIWATCWLIGWLSCGFTFRSTQNRSFRRQVSPSQSRPGMEKAKPNIRNPRSHHLKEMYYNSDRILKPG